MYQLIEVTKIDIITDYEINWNNQRMNQPGNMAHGFSVVGSVMCFRIDWHIRVV